MLVRAVRDLIISRHTVPCVEITRLASESLDRRLGVAERLRLRLHLQICVLCERYLKQIRFIRDALRRHPERLEHLRTSVPANLSPPARERLKRAVTGPQ